MITRRIKIIVNPNADLGRAGQTAAEIRPTLTSFGEVDWAESMYHGHAIQLAKDACNGNYDLIVAMGGDGTAHEVVNGLMQMPEETRPPLAVVPLGSGNDFSHAIGVNKNPSIALKQVIDGKLKKVDVVKFWDGNGRSEFFVNTLGIGFDATVTIRSRNNKFFKGFMIYLVAVIQTILFNHDAPLMKIRTDREEIESQNIMVVLCNGGREGGGFIVNTDAKPEDGILQYTLVKRVSRLMMLRLVPEFMSGNYHKTKQVRTGEFNHFELEADRPLTIHTDGEIFAGWGTDVRKIGAEVLPSALVVSV